MAKKRGTKPLINRTIVWGIIISLIVVLLGAWWFWPRLRPCLVDVPPQFNFILIKKNDQVLKVFDGDLLTLHPKDRIKILEISTNLCRRSEARLSAINFDVTALLYEEMSLSALLSDRDIFNRYKFRIVVKRFNQDLAHVDILVEPEIQDWLDRADRVIDKTKRVALLEQAFKLMPKEEQIRDRLIEEYKSLKSLPRVAKMLESVAKEDPGGETLFDLLEVYEDLSKTDEVISVLKRLIKINPDDVEIRAKLASNLEDAKKYKEAIGEYEKLLKVVDKGDRLPIYKTLGYLYSKTNRTRKAISSYLNAVTLDKKDVNLYYNLSSLYERRGQKDKADFFLKKAVSLKSGDVESRLKLAERLIKKGKFKEAEKYAREVLKRRSDSVEALLVLLKIQEKRGNKKSLKSTYKKLLALDPKNENIIHNLGLLEYETGNLSASLKYFRNLAKLHPKDPEVRLFLFDIYRKQKKEDLAFREAQTLITLRPKQAGPYHYAFEYLNRRKNYKKMVGIMRSAIKSNPKNIDFREYMILAYLETRQDILALYHMNEILRLKPKDLTNLLRLARLSEKKGKVKEALNAYKKILEISPSHEESEEAYLRLRLEVLPFQK